MRGLFSAEQQKAIKNLDIYDQRKHLGETNGQVAPGLNVVLSRENRNERAALQRTASFLLVKDVLKDIAKGIDQVTTSDPTLENFFTKSLLSAQLGSLHHQVEIGKNEVVQKCFRGERVLPRMLETTKFDTFLRQEKALLDDIVQNCRKSGPNRNRGLATALQRLAHRYLSSTNRLPSGLPKGKRVEYGEIVKIESKAVAVWVGDELFAGTTEYPPLPADVQMALIVIHPDDSTSALDDPSDGSQNERYYSMGFEHCDIPTKQAAVFIEKLFCELGYLETVIAEQKGGQSALAREANIAAASIADTSYVGSVALGDYCAERAGVDDRDHQRNDLVKRVAQLNIYAELFKTVDESLVLDPALAPWVSGPQFEIDMGGLKSPEERARVVNVEHVNRALRKTDIFRPPKVFSHD